MKNKFKLYLLLFLFLLFPSSIFANSFSEENIIIEENKQVEESSIQSSYEFNPNQGNESENKKKFQIDPNKKNDLYKSRGTILENRDSKGNPFDMKEEKFELLEFDTASNNKLYFLVDYSSSVENIFLLGKTNEQELSSLTENVSEKERQVKAELNRIEKEKEDFEKTKLEQAEKMREKSKNDKTMRILIFVFLPLLVIFIATLAIKFGLGKRFKIQEEYIDEEQEEEDDEEEYIDEDQEAYEKWKMKKK